VGLVVCLRSTT